MVKYFYWLDWRWIRAHRAAHDIYQFFLTWHHRYVFSIDPDTQPCHRTAIRWQDEPSTLFDERHRAMSNQSLQLVDSKESAHRSSSDRAPTPSVFEFDHLSRVELGTWSQADRHDWRECAIDRERRHPPNSTVAAVDFPVKKQIQPTSFHFLPSLFD